jgi:hypothetical protein
VDGLFFRVILRSDNKKRSLLGLFELINGRANDNFTMFAAGALLVAIPFAILFMSGQQFLLHSSRETASRNDAHVCRGSVEQRLKTRFRVSGNGFFIHMPIYSRKDYHGNK